MDDDTLRDWSDKRLLAPILGARLAERLLQHYGGLRQLLLADADSIRSRHGVGRARAAAIQALPELARRYFSQSLPRGQAIRSPTDTAGYLQSRMQHLEHELFCCLFLDNRHRIIRFDEMFRGTIDGTSVYPREVVKEALAINAAAVILAHNHPSGVAEPSRADERITKRLKSALELVDIRLLDHLIIGSGEATSLAARGML
ncbi:MAG: DNA repair protein RadC [Woeseiaceae bacterium]|nr:DNA repair protein RadC [Woeseiaceae bacterium]